LLKSVNLKKEVFKYNEPLKSDYESLSRNELEIRLHAFISNLLINDFEKLCNLIYRHDVSETKFNIALQLSDIDTQAWKITHLVIDREMHKVKTRRVYKENKDMKNRESIE
tara:strand:+ start:46 stop:378 length:333 start_codon:yes stop_codon:yes gene_type:complete